MPVVGDLAGEANETFFVNLSNPQHGVVETPQGTGTILNDDPHDFHNRNNGLDVNNDGLVAALDALIIINQLNGKPPTATFYPDVNDDGAVTPNDVVIVINYLLGTPGPAPVASPGVTASLSASPASSPAPLPSLAVDRAMGDWGGTRPAAVNPGFVATPARAVYFGPKKRADSSDPGLDSGL